MKTIKPTPTNLFALAQWAREGQPAKIPAVWLSHLRRCMSAGLIATVNGAPVLTDAGALAVQGVRS